MPDLGPVLAHASSLPVWLRVASALLLASVLAAPAASLPADDSASGPAEASYIGEQACRACHALEATHWDETLHADVFRAAARRRPGALAAHGCEACHGPGSAHSANPTESGSILAFTHGAETPVESQNAACLQCHLEGRRLHWPGSAHDAENVGCSDCHNPMQKQSARGLLRLATVNATCFSCHPSQRNQFRKRSHMPLLEGKLDCVDCHEPHGSVTPPLLMADDVNQLCTRCHPAQRGPFLWEHAPVTENCLNCHLPHGSNRESLLVSSPPFLCQQCHVQLDGFSLELGHANNLLTAGNLENGDQPDVRMLNRGCVNCHSQIHGSNHPSGARFHR